MTKPRLAPTGPSLPKSSIGSYTLLRKLGEGFSGSVFEARHKVSGREVAVKVPSRELLSRNPRILDLMAHEFRVLSTLDHRFVVKAVDFAESVLFRDRKGRRAFASPFLAVEKAGEGELCEMIVETGRLGEQASRFYFRQLIEAMAFLHSKGVAHRDIKPENILFDENLDLKLIDFAFANRIGDQPLQVVGTEGYLPPEVFLTRTLNLRKTDIFSAGVVLFIMLRGTPPFNSSRDSDPYYKLLSTEPEAFWKWQARIDPSNELPAPLRVLLQGMLHPDPNLRWGLSEIASNEWFRGQNDERSIRNLMRAKSLKLREIRIQKDQAHLI